MLHSEVVGPTFLVHDRTVRRWVKDFCKDEKFQVPQRDYTKREPHSFIDDNNFSLQCKEWLNEKIYRRKKGEPKLRSNDFRRSARDIISPRRI